ncbi:MAG TPA: TonB-dependent receptor [Chryseosolibacter sp.]
MNRNLQSTNLTAMALGLLFVLCYQAAWSQRVVSGKVTDEGGVGIPGVNVILENTTTGTTTDSEGTFSLSVNNDNVVLVFSFIGYATQRIEAGNQTTINVQMLPDEKTLQEVVFVGYGSQPKADVTGAIASVSAKAIEERQPVDVFEAMQGLAAGVQINTDPRPGGQPSIRIRGTSTLEGGTEPLFVVDGVPVDNINAINPNDIQSMEILKDASSAAIYGSRSANGVIIITTKKGVQGKPRIDVRYNTMLSTLAHKIEQATADDRRLYDRKRTSSATIPSLPADSLNPARNADNDLQEILTRTAVRHQVDFSVSGANDKLNYYTSLGYLRDDGIIHNSWANLARARINIDYKASEKFTFGNRMNFSHEKKNFINEGRVLQQAINRPPTFQLYYPDGTYAPSLGGRRNPLAFATEQVNEFQTYSATIYNYLSFQITDGLKLTTDFNIRGEFEDHLEFSPLIVEGTEGSYSNAFDTYWMQQNYLNYDKEFGDHKINAVVGISTEKWVDRNIQIEGENYVSESVVTTNAIADKFIDEINNTESRHAMVGMFGRASYNYKGKYIVNGTVRRDGSSRFGADNRWGYYPSASVGWRFTDESFMSWAQNVLDDGKFRASYGETGNDRIGNYNHLELYEFGDNFYNEVLGVVPSSTLGNPTLGWETTRQLNIGTDLSFFQGRVSFVADYYVKTTEDLLYQQALAPELGYEDIYVNVGSIENRGFEFMINAFPLKSTRVNWNVGYNMAFNNSKAVEFFNGRPFIHQNRWLIEEGGELGVFYGYKSLGVYPYAESNAWTPDGQRLEPVFSEETFTGDYLLDGTTYTGEIKKMSIPGGYVAAGGDMIWHDANGDFIIDDQDRLVLGNAQPDFTANLFNQIDYKGFSLSFNFYVQWGNEIYDYIRYDEGDFNGTNQTPDRLIIQAAWEKPGDITWVPRVPQARQVGNMREISSIYIENGSFIRLRNARLTYRFNRSLTDRLKLDGLSIYAYGNNLLTWTNYFWFDPEIPLGSPLEMGIDEGRSPRSRQAGLGINVNF